jgi:hypothetical protein
VQQVGERDLRDGASPSLRDLDEDLPAAELALSDEELRRLDDVSASPLLYPYWWQAKYDERLGEADLALLGRYQDVPIPEGGLHRALPGFDVMPGTAESPGGQRERT